MTHQRAIEAGARALCRLLFDHGDLEKVSSPKTRSLLEKEAVELFASLAEEGLVVVPREPSNKMICAALDDYDKRGRGKQSYCDIYTAMLAAAQEQNDARPSPEADR